MTLIKTYIANVSSLDDTSLFHHYYELVDKSRKEKINCYKFQKEKNLCLAAGVLLKLALANENIRNYEINITDKGKPYLVNCDNLFFNLSHSGQIAMCTLAPIKVGCDVERIKEKPPDITRMFINELEDETKFYELWTAKESYLKLTGDGFFRNPKDIVIKLPYSCQIIENKTVTFFDVSMAAMHLTGKSYQITVCVEGRLSEDNVYVEGVDLGSVRL